MINKIIILVMFFNFLFSQSTTPIYQFLHKKNKEHYYTKNPKPKGDWKHQGIKFNAYTEETPGTIPIFQFLHKKNKDHFYTKNPAPEGNWKHQGIAFYAFENYKPGTTPIYIFYSKKNKDHYYTKNPNPEGKWKAQGIAFYAFNIEELMSYGCSTTKEEAINRALISATKSYIITADKETKNLDLTELDEKIDKFINENVSNHKVLKEYNDGARYHVIVSYRYLEIDLYKIFGLKQLTAQKPKTLFSNTVQDNESMLRKIRYEENVFAEFFNQIKFGNPYDIKYERKEPEPYSEEYFKLQFDINFNLNDNYKKYFDFLLTYLSFFSISEKDGINLLFGKRGIEHSLLENFISGKDPYFIYGKNMNEKFGNFIAYSKKKSKTSWAGNLYEPAIGLKNMRLYSLYSDSTIKMIHNYNKELLYKTSLKTTFSYSDESSDENFNIIYLDGFMGRTWVQDDRKGGVFLQSDYQKKGQYKLARWKTQYHASKSKKGENGKEIGKILEKDAIVNWVESGLIGTITVSDDKDIRSRISLEIPMEYFVFSEPYSHTARKKWTVISKTYSSLAGSYGYSESQGSKPSFHWTKKYYKKSYIPIDLTLLLPSEKIKNVTSIDLVIPKKEELDYLDYNYFIPNKKSSKFITCGTGNCKTNGAKQFTINRIKSTIGNVQFLDLYDCNSNTWIFYGSAWSSTYQTDVTIWVKVSCNDGIYNIENVKTDI